MRLLQCCTAQPSLPNTIPRPGPGSQAPAHIDAGPLVMQSAQTRQNRLGLFGVVLEPKSEEQGGGQGWRAAAGTARGPEADRLCDLREVALPVWALVLLSVNRGAVAVSTLRTPLHG